MSETKRRDFLKILGIGSAAGLGGACSKTAPDALTPYVKPPEEMVRGHALWFRGTCRECPAGCGIEARVREGRVHKVEGNPEHPVNAGGLCARGQAAVQGLYNPDRLRAPLIRDATGKLAPVGWGEAEKALAARFTARKDEAAAVTGCVTGAIEEAVAGWLAARGSRRHMQYEAVAYERLRAANRLCFGVASLPVLRFAEARAIYLFGADAIETYISPVGYARGIAEARRGGARMVYVGSRMSLTGARADQWVPVPQGREGRVAMALVRELLSGASAPQFARIRKWSDPFTAERAGADPNQLRAMAREIAKGPFLGAAGDDTATAVAVNLLNAVAGALNRTVSFDRAPALDRATSKPDISGVKALLVLEANPAYACPGFAEALREVPFVAALTPYPDETAALAHLVLPVHTPLEAWGDYEPWTGIHCLQQPAMRPVFDTRDAGDILTGAPFRDFVRARWKGEFEAALERGGEWREAPARRVALADADFGPLLEPLLAAPRDGYTLQTYPSLAHFDGRGANRPWLQELPDPITLAVWDTWAEIHPKDAATLGVKTGDGVRIASARGQIETAAYVYPGIYPGTVGVPLGQGHTAFGRYATGVGANASVLGPSGEPVRIAPAPAKANLVTIAGQALQEHRAIARSRAAGQPAPPREHRELSLYAPHQHKPHRWAMAIDLDACNACSACVTACYAENNLPVMGKEEVGRGRHMSWIRLERFFGPGDRVSDPFRIDYTPMLCQQCDNAPCESVCPVYAAYHTEEGLNGQVYNRCVGTRYCANNCPYKVRRFNWFETRWTAPLDWQLNPDVTVRSRGVMEKCTFCVQRITVAKDLARREGRPVADGDAAPACAQTCPTRAIVFGDLDDPRSRIRQVWEHPRRYRVLEDLNTRPAVIYLERDRRLT
jgi:molybdopterin-containing oxidoreductase family iron-sulfur binding subunit